MFMLHPISILVRDDDDPNSHRKKDISKKEKHRIKPQNGRSFSSASFSHTLCLA